MIFCDQRNQLYKSLILGRLKNYAQSSCTDTETSLLTVKDINLSTIVTISHQISVPPTATQSVATTGFNTCTLMTVGKIGSNASDFPICTFMNYYQR